MTQKKSRAVWFLLSISPWIATLKFSMITVCTGIVLDQNLSLRDQAHSQTGKCSLGDFASSALLSKSRSSVCYSSPVRSMQWPLIPLKEEDVGEKFRPRAFPETSNSLGHQGGARTVFLVVQPRPSIKRLHFPVLLFIVQNLL